MVRSTNLRRACILSLGVVTSSHVVSGLGRTVTAQTLSKQAVVETTAGTFVVDLTPATAPNQAAYFMKLAAEGGYDGTIFHRAVKYGMVQGGDPLTKDPSKRALYGTGGQNAVKAEARAPKMTRGSVAAVLVPGKPDSAGAQFFIVLADQPALDNQYTVFGRVSDGIEVLQKISEVPVDDKGVATERIEIRRVTIRDTPAEPFVSETPQQLGAYRAVLDTSSGPITSISQRCSNVRRRRRASGTSFGPGFGPRTRWIATSRFSPRCTSSCLPSAAALVRRSRR